MKKERIEAIFLFFLSLPVGIISGMGKKDRIVVEFYTHNYSRKFKIDDICRKFMPEWSEGAFSDSRTELNFGDAFSRCASLWDFRSLLYSLSLYIWRSLWKRAGFSLIKNHSFGSHDYE